MWPMFNWGTGCHDPDSLLVAGDESVSKCKHMNKFTLRFFKKKWVIKYIISFFLKDLWDIVYVTALKELVE